MHTPGTPHPPATRTLDWNTVPFPVACARCGQDLRGLSEPRCPACSLEFDWADAVPLEHLTCAVCGYHLYGLQQTRCPECGRDFKWEEALDRYRRRRKDLFEYRWRDSPVRSFLRTWWRSLRPSKFWRSIDVHDPPGAGPLLIFSFGPLLVALLIAVLLTAWNISLWNTYPGMGWAARLRVFVAALDLPPLPAVLGVMAWVLAGFASLLVLRQSMARCRVRTAHVLRACAYALPVAIPFAVAGLGLAVCVESWLIITTTWPPTGWLREVRTFAMVAGFGAVGFLPLFATWSLARAYRSYIRMPHAMGVAIASQLIAILACGAVTAIVAVAFGS